MVVVEGGGYIFPCGIYGDHTQALMQAKIWLRIQPDRDHTVSVLVVPFGRPFPIGPAGLPKDFIAAYTYEWDHGIGRFKLRTFSQNIGE
jgi:hypothetical protein